MAMQEKKNTVLNTEAIGKWWMVHGEWKRKPQILTNEEMKEPKQKRSKEMSPSTKYIQYY